jgi:hypothetical protein
MSVQEVRDVSSGCRVPAHDKAVRAPNGHEEPGCVTVHAGLPEANATTQTVRLEPNGNVS